MTRHAMIGMRKCATQFAWPVACETIGGANVQTPAPNQAASRELTRCRENSQYHAVPVAAMPTMSTMAHETVGPNSSVTGVSGTDSPSIGVLAIMFTPSGAF